jgi:hypothetical protein
MERKIHGDGETRWVTFSLIFASVDESLFFWNTSVEDGIGRSAK